MGRADIDSMFNEMNKGTINFTEVCTEPKSEKTTGLVISELYVQMHSDDYDFKNLFNIHAKSLIGSYKIVDNEQGVLLRI